MLPSPAPLTPYDINVIFQQLTIEVLGYPPNSDDIVRVGWQLMGQPTGTVEEDIIYIQAIEDDDEYNKVREPIPYPQDDGTISNAVAYTRVWRVSWTFYGPHSFDHARKLRSALLNDESHDMIEANRLYLISDIVAPQRNPEYYTGEWWERVDFVARFNEAVTETEEVGTAKSVEVVAFDQNTSPTSPLIDETISATSTTDNLRR